MKVQKSVAWSRIWSAAKGKCTQEGPIQAQVSASISSSPRVWFSFNFSFFYVLQDKFPKVAHLG